MQVKFNVYDTVLVDGTITGYGDLIGTVIAVDTPELLQQPFYHVKVIYVAYGACPETVYIAEKFVQKIVLLQPGHRVKRNDDGVLGTIKNFGCRLGQHNHYYVNWDDGNLGYPNEKDFTPLNQYIMRTDEREHTVNLITLKTAETLIEPFNNEYRVVGQDGSLPVPLYYGSYDECVQWQHKNCC